MVSNKIIFYLTIVAIIVIITIPTIAKVNNVHLERLFKVETLKIKEKAMDCYLKNECKEKITLKELIDKNYLTRGIDPRTDEYFKDDVYVTIKDYKPILFIDNIEIKEGEK